MNVYVKYGTLLLLVICINLAFTEAISISKEDFTSFTNECSFIPARQDSNTPQKFDEYAKSLNISCDLVNMLVSKIPEAKCIIISTGNSLKPGQINDSLFKANANTSRIYFSSPAVYYVFGLKKIII